MSLADELLADLEENDDGELEAAIESKTSNDANHEFAVPYPVIPKEEDIKNVSIRELAKLRYSERLSRVSCDYNTFHCKKKSFYTDDFRL